MACEAIIRHCLDGKRPAPGARPATGDLELEDYEALFARRAIQFGVREQTAATAALPLYRRLLGEAYQRDAGAAAGDARSDGRHDGGRNARR